MSKQVVLTGITTTGTPHLGNYVGAIKPAIESSQDAALSTYYFLADYHALIKCEDPERVHRSSLEIAAAWLALGLDTGNAVFYRQSDVPAVTELTWIISCVTAKGLMNRAHAYKATVAENESQRSQDPDKGITMGLYGYPVLMAADILMFKANKVPVGRDQVQHLEMARDIAQRFNHLYGEHFVLPEAVVDDSTAVLSGLDGRKMSKSYNNTIPLFVPEKQLRKLIMKIKTDSLEPGEPKDPEQSTLFEIYHAFATAEQSAAIRQRYAAGIAWGEMKQLLFTHLNDLLAPARERYEALLADPGHVENELRRGGERARDLSAPLMDAIRRAVGIRPLS